MGDVVKFFVTVFCATAEETHSYVFVLRLRLAAGRRTQSLTNVALRIAKPLKYDEYEKRADRTSGDERGDETRRDERSSRAAQH